MILNFYFETSEGNVQKKREDKANSGFRMTRRGLAFFKSKLLVIVAWSIVYRQKIRSFSPIFLCVTSYLSTVRRTSVKILFILKYTSIEYTFRMVSPNSLILTIRS